MKQPSGFDDYTRNLAYIQEINWQIGDSGFSFLDLVQHSTGEISPTERVIAMDALGRAIGKGDVRVDEASGKMSLTNNGSQRVQDFVDRIHS